MPKFQAPPIRTPFIGNPPKVKVDGDARTGDAMNVPSYAWTNYFQNITNALSTVAPPAASSSPGTAGQRAFDANFEYICVAANTWKRVALSAF